MQRASRGPRAIASRGACALAVALLTGVCGACFETEPACYAGDHRACACAVPAGARGYQACLEGGGGYAPCVCDGTTPGVDGSAPDAADDGAPDATAKKELLAACEKNEDCASGLCFAFNAKGQRCSKACTSASDCPAPSPGCNNLGICKAP